MNVKTTIVLLILLILCAGYVLVFHTGWFGVRDKPEEVIEPDKRLAGDIGRIHRLVLEQTGSENIVIVRADGKWRIIEPVEAPAAEWQVDSTVSTATGLRYVRKYAGDDPQCPRDDLTGLSAPLCTVTVTDENGKACTIKVGRNAPAPPAGRTYVQITGDNHVYVVEADLHESLTGTLDDYRQKYVARFDVDKAVRASVLGGENYQLIKTGDKWAIDKPVAARAENEKVKDFLRAVSDIQADEFIDDDPENLAPYGLDKPRLVVTVELAAPESKPAENAPATKPAPKGKVISVAFGAVADKKVFAKLADQPWVFRIAESELKNLQPKLSDLRDKNVMDIAGREITRIEITLSAGGSATLEKVEEKWRMRRPFEGACDDEAVEELVSAIRNLKAGEFRDNPTTLAAFGLEEPKGRIVLHFRGSDKTDALMLGRTSSSGQRGFVKPARSKSVAVVSSADLDRLSRPSPAYRNRTIFEMPEEVQIVSVSLERPGYGTIALRKSAEGIFKLYQPVEGKGRREIGPVDQENLQSVLDALKTVRADKIVVLNNTLPERYAKAGRIRASVMIKKPIQPSASQPATAPATAPTTTQASKPTTEPAKPAFRTELVTLLIMKDKGDSYVWLEEARPFVVGKLEEQFYDKFAAEMRDRSVMKKLNADEIVSIKIDMEKTTIEFIRSGPVWRYAADTLVKVDAERIMNFLSDLSALKADRFADYGAKPNLIRFGLDKPAMTITLKTDDDKKYLLKMARTGPVGTKGLYATGGDVPGVFVLTPETQKKMTKSMKDFRKDSSR